jgi:hypothetical protein
VRRSDELSKVLGQDAHPVLGRPLSEMPTYRDVSGLMVAGRGRVTKLGEHSVTSSAYTFTAPEAVLQTVGSTYPRQDARDSQLLLAGLHFESET